MNRVCTYLGFERFHGSGVGIVDEERVWALVVYRSTCHSMHAQDRSDAQTLGLGIPSTDRRTFKRLAAILDPICPSPMKPSVVHGGFPVPMPRRG